MIDRNIADLEKRLPLLITGIASVSGYNAFQYFTKRYPGQVIGTRRAAYWPLRGEGIVGCDVEDRDEIRRLFDKHQFQSVLNCGGSCALKSCELDPELAWRANVAGVENLVEEIQSTDVRMLHLSIDLVFSGVDEGGYVETDPTDPVTIYGKTMVEGENRISPDLNACTLRISLPMGISFNGHAGAIDWIQSRFKNARPATLYYDEVRTPTYTDCMNKLFHQLLISDLRGLYHFGGTRRLSLYQIAQIVNRVGGYDPNDLIGCFRIEAGPMPPRAGNVTLDSTKLASALGFEPFDPWPLDESLVPTHDKWHYDRPDDQEHSPEELSRVLYRNPRNQGGPNIS